MRTQGNPARAVVVNLSAAVSYHARVRPQATALIYEGQQISYAMLEERIGALAGWLARRGIVAGDVVALLMKNSSAFIEATIAIGHLGAVLLPINFRLAANEVNYILDNAGARLLLVDEELQAQAGGFGQTVVVPPLAQHDMRALAGAGGARVPLAVRGADDLFRLMYTSGTTDRPKGVMHSYGNFYWKCMDHVIALGLSASDRLLVVGPLYHVGAFDLPGLAVLWLGGTLCILREFDAESSLRAIEREGLTGAWMAPVMLNSLLPAAARGGHHLDSFRWCIGGGEKTPEARIRAFTQAFPSARYIDAYGLTETCSGDTLMEAGRELDKIGSCGRPTAHVALRICDGDGNALPAREEGEICLRGPKVTRGYWRDEAKTRASFFGDWLRTGDIGYVDEEGFLFLTDRKKDMIISGGENIASSEVERVIYQLPQVLEAAVIGVPDARWGERPVAVVVLRPETTLDLAALESHCRQHLAGFKVPKALHLRAALPRNPSGKILKRQLRDELRDELCDSAREPARDAHPTGRSQA